MQQWNEFEKAQNAALKGPPKQLIKCVECGGSWFECIELSQFDANKMSSLGQRPPYDGSTYFVLKCGRCGELHEPPVNRVMFNTETKDYDSMLDELQAPKETHGGRREQERNKEKSE